MAKRTRKSMTEQNYNNIKKVAKVLEQANGKQPSGVELSRLTGYSNTTISRVLLTKDYPEYVAYQRVVAHGKKFTPEAVTPEDNVSEPQQGGEVIDPVVEQLRLIKRSVELQETQFTATLDHMARVETLVAETNLVATRQAAALEALVDAWNNKGKKGLLNR